LFIDFTAAVKRIWPIKQSRSDFGLGFQVKVLETFEAFPLGLDAGHTYRGTSLIRNSSPLELYSRNMPRALRWSQGEGLFLMSEVPL